jgi:LEA14-like dessication related protein
MSNTLTKLVKFTFIALTAMILLQGCASLSPKFEQPEVEVLSIQRLPSTGMEQRFAMGLKVLNPNSRALNIKGMSYSLSIENYTVATGVSAEVPTVAAYSEERFSLPVSTSLLSSIGLLKHLVALDKPSLSYRLEAKLDLGIPLAPKMRVVEEGNVDLGQLQ